MLSTSVRIKKYHTKVPEKKILCARFCGISTFVMLIASVLTIVKHCQTIAACDTLILLGCVGIMSTLIITGFFILIHLGDFASEETWLEAKEEKTEQETINEIFKKRLANNK